MDYLLPVNCSSITENTYYDTSPYEVDKIYVVLAMATATLSFFLNFSQFVVIIHQKLLRRNKNIIIINLCICGQLSSFTVFWYIYKVITFWQEERMPDNYLICFLLPSGMHLLTIFTFTPLITLLVLQHHLVVKPMTCRHLRKSHVVIGLFVILAWCEAVIISLIPLTGWNNWQNYCSLPFVWSSSFSILICVIYFLHYPIVLILLIDLCLWTAKRRRSVCPELLKELPALKYSEVGETRPDELPPLSSKCIIVLFVFYMIGTLPFIFYTATAALDQEADLCRSLVANEKAAMWTSWLTVVFAAVRPLFHVIVEEDLGEGTTDFIAKLCQWPRKL